MIRGGQLYQPVLEIVGIFGDTFAVTVGLSICTGREQDTLRIRLDGNGTKDHSSRTPVPPFP
jgi:hypothetical protein